MKRIHIIISFLLVSFSLSAQDTLTLEKCMEMTVENSPRLKDRQQIDEAGRLTLENVKTSWYPELTLNGKLTYQSDVVSISIDQPGLTLEFPEMPHQQYAVNLDVRQTLYDGGYSKQQKEYQQRLTAASLQQIEVDMQSLREQVSNLYFSILLLQENRNTLEILLENLKAREVTIESAVENGVAEKSDLMIIQVEIMKILQSLSELDAGRSGLLRMLAVYTGQELDMQMNLSVPFLEIPDAEMPARPELQWMDLQMDVLTQGQELSAVKRMPKVFAYGQAGLGMPGYNMLNDQTDTYYMVGAGFQWKIWDWKETAREKQILETKKQVIEHSRETFLMNIKAGQQKELENMDHYSNALDLDAKMLAMRTEISRTAASKVDNGVISATDYLQILSEETQARVLQSTHKMQLIKAIANYNLLNGTL